MELTDARSTADRLRGPIGFPVTPFHDDDDRSLDLTAFAEQLDTMAGGGLAALVVAGGTGEMFALTPAEIDRLTREAVDVVAGRMPVLIGTGFNVALGREIAARGAEAGAAGVVVLPPAYPSPDREALVAYYREIAAAVPGLAVVPYSRGDARITPEILEQLAGVPNITAFKDGHGDVRLFQRNRDRLGDRFVWLAGTGDDLLGPYAAAGAEGFTSSVACFDPALAVELWRLATEGRFAELDELSGRMVRPWYELRVRRPGYEVSVMKAALRAYGLDVGPVRPPLAPVGPEDEETIRGLAASIGLFAASSRAGGRA